MRASSLANVKVYISDALELPAVYIGPLGMTFHGTTDIRVTLDSIYYLF